MDGFDVELILARHLMSRLAVPVLLVDAKGDTLFYNEAAQEIIGQRFEDYQALPFEERLAILAPRDTKGRRLHPSRLPGFTAMRTRRPAHTSFVLHDVQGHGHTVEATAVPLESAAGQVLGAMIVVWKTAARRQRTPSHNR